MLTPQQALEKYFGFRNFRDGQEIAIQRTLDNKHTLLVMPTGSGKSLAYQLPAMLKPGLTLVISPLIALMKDQVDGLVEAGLPATYINSSLSAQETSHRIRAVLEGDIKLLYIAPERLRNRQFTQAISNTEIGLLAVDEAHCISQWGHDFRPDYLQVGPTWQAMGEPTLLATTATATPVVQKDILNLLQAKQAEAIVMGFNRPNLTFQVKHTPDDRTKMRTLQSIIQRLDGSIIIYAATRRNADDVADFVQSTMGIPAHSYHAGLDREWRTQVQNKFMADQIRVVVATNAFGMGVDKPDVRAVLHYNLPSTVEAYYQESGRAGRDGLPAECILLFAPDDQRLQEWMIDSDTPAFEDLHQVYALLANAANGEEVYVTSQELAHSSGLHPVKLRVTLSELEQASLIYHMGNEGYHDHWKISPLSHEALEKRATVIEQRSERRHALLGQMLNYAHLTSCRRRFMLAYFGDTSTPDAPNCCDNHATSDISTLPKAVTPQEWYPLIVLDTVRSLAQRPVGRNRLAQVLSGSQSKGIQEFGYDKHRFYGKLNHFNQKQIVQLIDGLIENRYLLIEGGKLPVLRTTPLGVQALDARAALPIRLPDIVYDQKPRAGRSDTVKRTLEMHKAGLTPAQIAAQRSLTENTIYDHLTRLVSEEKVALHDFISPDIEAEILEAVKQVGSAAALRPIKDTLPETISFSLIRCVLAAHPELSRAAVSMPAKKPADDPATLTPPRSLAQTVPEPSTTSVDTIILEAIAKLGGTLGRSGLAKFLTGSRVNWLEVFSSHAYYGCLPDLSQQAVIDVIDALIADGKLVTSSGHRPKVMLSDQDMSTPPTDIEHITNENPPVAPVSTLVEDSADSTQALPETQALLEKLRQWRTSEAKSQGMPPYIIFSNKVLESIASQQPQTLSQLSHLSGIGPAKLEKYGEAVIALITDTANTATNDTPPQSQIAETLAKFSVSAQQMPASNNVHIDKYKQKVDPKMPTDVITAALEELDGLITLQALAHLLTAEPDDIVPFSDNEFRSKFHDEFSYAEIEAEIQKAIKAGIVLLNSREKLMMKKQK